jgi:hypothetical protein
MKSRFGKMALFGFASLALGVAFGPSSQAAVGTRIECSIFDTLQQEPVRLQILHDRRAVRGRFHPHSLRGSGRMNVIARQSRLNPGTMTYDFAYRVRRPAEGHYVRNYHPIERITYTGVLRLNMADPAHSTYVLNSDGYLGRSSRIGVRGFEETALCVLKPLARASSRRLSSY